MKSAILGMFILALVPWAGQAQSSAFSKGHGYGFLGAGGRGDGRLDVHFGGGGEFFFNRHVGVGAEAGLVAEANRFNRYDDLNGIKVFSPNFVARFRAMDEKTRTEPFVTAGYSLLYHYGADPGVNFGGGINWWFKERLGLRFEIRDYILQPFSDVRVTYHLVGAHIGLTFR